jgi:hypothetical protein
VAAFADGSFPKPGRAENHAAGTWLIWGLICDMPGKTTQGPPAQAACRSTPHQPAR